MTVEISIIMSVYNTEKYLNECLDSILAQTFQNWECICVDDGSTDGSGKILDDYAQKDRRFTVMHVEHSNAGHGRNMGMRKVQGKYLSFLDSDDVFASRMLEILHEAAVVSSADVVFCDYCKFLDGEALPELSNNWNRSKSKILNQRPEQENLFFVIGGMAWNKLFKADFIFSQNIEFQEQQATNDARFVLTASCLAKRIVMLGDFLIAYRQRLDSLQHTRSQNPDCKYKMLLSFYENMTSRGIFPANHHLLLNFKLYCIIFSIFSVDVLPGVEGCEEAYDCLKKIVADLDLYEVLNNPVPPEVAEFLDLIKRDGSLFEFCRMRNRQMREYIFKKLERNPVAFVELIETKNTRHRLHLMYRLRMLFTYIPHKIYSKYLAYKGRRAFDRQCRRPLGH